MRRQRKLVWVFLALLIVGAAALDAHAITTLVGARLAPDARALAAPPIERRAPALPEPERTPSADPIVKRNPFDHATSLLPQGAPDPAPPAQPSWIEPKDAPPCAGLRVAAIAASSDPDWSFTALVGGGGTPSELRRRGDAIGDRKVAFIGWDRVWLSQGGGALCQAQLFAPKVVAAPPGATSAAPTVAPPSNVPPDIARGIKRISATEYAIDRGALDRILESQHQLMAQTRIVPDMIDGRVAGIRLLGIKPDSILGMIGLVNGDRLDSINGMDISSPERALEAYAKIRTGERFTLKITRNGAPLTLDYAVK